MSVKLLSQDGMDSDSDFEDNSKEILRNGVKPDGYVDCETLQCDLNENRDAGLKEIHSIGNLSSSFEELHSSLENMSGQALGHGDSKISSETCALNTNSLSDDCIGIEPQELSSISLTNVTDSDYITNSNIQEVNISDGTEALSYFSDSQKDVIEEETAVEAICEEKTLPADIPNGISKTLTKSSKNNLPTKQRPHDRKKCKKILFALKNNDKDSLKLAAISEGGLLTDEIRKKVWPKLVGVDIYETSPRPCQKEIEAHPYYGQVVLDVNRSLKRFPPSIHEAQRLMMLDQLVFLIMRVLCRHPEMHYYQGYHDICVTFLLVLGEEMAYHVVEKLSTTHLKVFMERNMEPTIHLLEHMYVLIGKESPILKEFLLKSEVGVAYCLSWLITWFGHVLNDYNYVVRLFDFFIVSHPYMPMYLTAAIVLHQETEVLKQDCDMASVHSYLSNISDDLPFEELILDSLSLFEEYSPELLSVEHPYVPRSLMKPKKKFGVFQSISKTIKRVVPASNIAIPIVVAAAVLVTAVLYQAYKY